MSFTLAIVGRPNVGKSTLFNRLVGKRLALVDDQPGVTRDLREGAARLGDLNFTVIDTAGLEDATDESLQGRMRKLTERAVANSDVCLFVIDGREGVTAADEIFANTLRRSSAEVILAVNKAESRAAEVGAMEAYSLGLGDPLIISGEHGEGMGDLYAILQPIYDRFTAMEREAETLSHFEAPATDVSADDDDEDMYQISADRPLQVAVVGRPNAGKSTLINKLRGDDRLLTGPEAGITRDSIGLKFEWDGTPCRIFDTAGLRKKARIQEKVEKLSASDAIRSIRFAEVVIVLLDVERPFESQDLRIADLAAREGRAVVFAANKWDLVDNKQEKLKELREQLDRLLPQLSGVSLITVSGLTGRGLDRLHNAVIAAHKVWNIRISTAKLNNWLMDRLERHTPPAVSGRRLRLRYITQAKTRPPTFISFSAKADDFPDSYVRYLINGLRDDFNIKGSPIRLYLRKGENPYADKKKKRGHGN